MTQETTIRSVHTCRDSQPKYSGVVPRNKAEFTLKPTYHMQLTGKNKKFVHLTFVCPYITNTIPNYNQQDATFLDLFISTGAIYRSFCRNK